jgi:Ras GTPase-activating-like protein IQGAP2/3
MLCSTTYSSIENRIVYQVYEEMVNQIEEEGRDLPPDMPRSVTPDVAAANPDVIAILQPRITMLIDVANRFLETIMESLDQVPYGIRWICKQIRSLTKRKYPEATDIAICSLIGGFFFLRFLNPAIVTPQAYMLVDRLPGKHPRTTLTLVRISNHLYLLYILSVGHPAHLP